MTETCLWCEEAVEPRDSPVPIGTEEGRRWTHRECALREVTGGIGHLIAHEYWCSQRKDPDAGLTARQSALLVLRWWEVVGRDAAARPPGEPDPEWVQELATSDDDEEWATAVVQWAESPEPPEEGPPGRTDQVPGSGAVWGPPRAL